MKISQHKSTLRQRTTINDMLLIPEALVSKTELRALVSPFIMNGINAIAAERKAQVIFINSN